MPESFDVNNFGVTDTRVVGNLEAAEEFFSADDDLLNGKLKTIKEADEDEAKKKAEAAKKKAKTTKKEDEEEEIVEEEDPVDPLAEIKDKETKEEETEETEETKDKEEKEEEVVEGNNYEEFSKDLFKLGIFTQQDNETPIKTGQDLLNRFQLEKQAGATQWIDDFIGRFGDDRKQLFEDIFINGVDPSEYIPVYNEVQNFDGLDLTVETNQEKVYREFYRRQGMDDDKIEKRLQKTKDYGDLETDAKDLIDHIVSQDKEKLEQMAVQKRAQLENQTRMDAEYKTGLQKHLNEALKNKEFKGIPVNEKKVREAFDFLYTPKYKTPSGQLLTDFDKFILESKKPENLDSRLILTLLKLDNFDFKNIKKAAISEESKEIFNSLAHKVTKEKTRATKVQSQSSSDWSHNL